ncbi:MAG: hemerythrin domain-containing protein [Candidatus Nanopelagicales bacterium]
MCSYCGCRAIPEIAALNEQHDQIVNASGDLRRATDAGTDVVAPLSDLVRLLAQHLDREERGLFTELRHHDEIRSHVDELCDQHDELQMMLADIGDRQDADPAAVGRLVTFLRQHIDREENGLFPAAAISMDGAEWDAIEGRIN